MGLKCPPTQVSGHLVCTKSVCQLQWVIHGPGPQGHRDSVQAGVCTPRHQVRCTEVAQEFRGQAHYRKGSLGKLRGDCRQVCCCLQPLNFINAENAFVPPLRKAAVKATCLCDRLQAGGVVPSPLKQLSSSLREEGRPSQQARKVMGLWNPRQQFL